MGEAPNEPVCLHATAVAIDGFAVLLRGGSGSGKSDLALRLIDGGASLVADDQVVLAADPPVVRCSPPEALTGLLEVRGVGIVACEHRAEVPIALIVDLVPREAVDRHPDARFETLLGIGVPKLALHAFDASTPAKIRRALQSLLA
ncbi:MAG: aldolase [Pseudomonadota bacterium]